jgi:multiple sugar transport system substrate-binding protein
MKRIVISLSLLLAMLVALSGGMASTKAVAQEVVEISFLTYLTGPDGAYYEALVNQFNEEHPNIKVNFLVESGGAEYQSKLVLSIRSGDAPAAVLLHLDEMPRYINNEMIYGWSTADWETTFGVSLADFAPSTVAYAVVDDMVYGVTLTAYHLALYYNADHFVAAGLDPDKPPTTWDEFVEYGQALTTDTNDDGEIDQWGYFCHGGWQFRVLWQWYSLFWEMGGELLNEDQTGVAFNNETGVAALQYFVDLIEKDNICPAEPSDGEQAFALGTLSMHTNGPWMIAYFDSIEELNWRVANLPKYEGNAAAWGSTHTLTVPKGVSDAEHAAAVEFGAWMASHTVELAAAGAYPVRQSVAESESFKELPAHAVFAAGAAEYLHLPPALEFWPAAEAIFIEYFQGALLGDISAEQAIQASADEIQALFEE